MVIRKNGVIRLYYDLSIGEKLRNKANEKINIIIKKEDSMEKRKKQMIYDAWNRICACMDRIDDTLDYLNQIELGKCIDKRAAFDFYEYINCSYVIIECIEALCHIFNVNKSCTAFRKENGIFESKGTDEEYFKYIRSLASVHPVNTNGRHPYIDEQIVVQCSPFVAWVSPKTKPFNKNNCDLEMVVYSSRNGDKIDWIHLLVDDFDKYLTKWINVIYNVVDAIDNYNTNYIDSYKKISLRSKKEFGNIVDYLMYLKEESATRNGDDWDYLFDKYISIFNLKLSNEDNLEKLNKYRNAIEYSLGFYANALQNMSFEGFENTGINHAVSYIETDLFNALDNCYNFDSSFKQYSYNLEKSYMLDPKSPYTFYDKIFARNLIKEMIPLLSKYVKIIGDEPDVELMILVDLARYLDCFESKSLINKNIPNDLLYREKLLSDEELKDLNTEAENSNDDYSNADVDEIVNIVKRYKGNMND